VSRTRLLAVGALVAAGLLLSACGLGGTTASSSTTTSTSATTTLPPAGAENLFISAGTIAELVATFDAYEHFAPSDVAGTSPGSIYYGYVPATRTYWARAEFLPSATAPLAVDVAMQDGGRDVIFARAPGQPWRAIFAVGEPFCTGLLHDPVPKSILSIWQLCQAGGVNPTTPQRCQTSHLSVKLGAFTGAAGTDLFPLVFTNTGTFTCLLQGFPGVSYEGASGSQVAAPAERVGTTDGPVLTVAPGGSAVANVVVTGGAVGLCPHPRTVVGFRVYPPNQFTSIVVPTLHVVACPNEPQGALQISAFGVRAQL
jgi:Protein of unknown function (DUF4232)